MDKLKIISILIFAVFLYACQGGGDGKAESGTAVPINYSAKFIAQPKDTGLLNYETTQKLLNYLSTSLNNTLYIPKQDIYIMNDQCYEANAFFMAPDKIIMCDELVLDILSFSEVYSSDYNLPPSILFSLIYLAIFKHELMHAYSYQADWHWGINEERNADVYALVASIEYSDTRAERIQNASEFIALGHFLATKGDYYSGWDLHDPNGTRAKYFICLAVGGVPEVLEEYPQFTNVYSIINAEKNYMCPNFYEDSVPPVREDFGTYVKE